MLQSVEMILGDLGGPPDCTDRPITPSWFEAARRGSLPHVWTPIGPIIREQEGIYRSRVVSVHLGRHLSMILEPTSKLEDHQIPDSEG